MNMFLVRSATTLHTHGLELKQWARQWHHPTFLGFTNLFKAWMRRGVPQSMWKVTLFHSRHSHSSIKLSKRYSFRMKTTHPFREGRYTKKGAKNLPSALNLKSVIAAAPSVFKEGSDEEWNFRFLGARLFLFSAQTCAARLESFARRIASTLTTKHHVAPLCEHILLIAISVARSSMATQPPTTMQKSQHNAVHNEHHLKFILHGYHNA